MSDRVYEYKGRKVYLQKEFKELKMMLVSFTGNGKGMFKIPTK